MSQNVWSVVRAAFFALICGGWVFPLVLAVITVADGSNLVAAGQTGRHSFPYFHFARQAAVVAGIWAVVGGGTWVAERILRRHA